MNQRSLLRLLLRPSLLSGSFVLLLALGTVIYSAWLYLNHDQILFTLLFGPAGFQDFVSKNTGGFMVWQRVLLGSPAAYYVLVGGIAMATGLAVFTTLQIFGLLFRNTTFFVYEAIEGRHARWAFWSEQLARLWVRVLALLGGAVYAAAFVSMILPFCILLNQTGVAGLRQGNGLGLLMGVAALLVLLLALHVLVVLARIIALRPRVFGGDSDIAVAETQGGR